MHINSAVGRVKNILMLTTSSCARCGPDAADTLRHLSRFLNLGFGLLIQLANGPLTSDDLDPFIAADLCTEEEAAALVSSPDPMALSFSWACICIDDLHRVRGAFTDSTVLLLQTQMTELRNNCGDAMLYIQTQLPYAAIQIISVVVFAFLTQLIVVSGGLIGTGLRNNALEAIFMGYFTLALVTFIYLGLLNLHSEVGDVAHSIGAIAS
jgi:hypothetical protein